MSRFRLALAGCLLVSAACSSGAGSIPEADATTPVTISSVPLSPSPSEPDCTITGTPKGDTLTGTEADDVICALGGDDIVRGGGGNDVLLGGKGDDRLAPGPGDDELDGGPGADLADYAKATAALTANLRDGTAVDDGSDSLTEIEGLIGTAFADTITGSAAANVIAAGGGDDKVHAQGGDDIVHGEEGDDILVGDAGVDTCPQGPGSARTDCERTWVPVPFARASGLTLFTPAEDPLLIAYHESLFPSAIAMKPMGGKDSWMIQPSRGRGTPATSAVDIPLPAGTEVVAPVDGRVLDVVPYSLYCEAPDTLVVIRPDEDRDLTVEVLHLVEVKVRKGDEVIAGGTVLGQPHLFTGGTNQVDAYVPGNPPHVHIEVEADGSTRVPDCNYPRGVAPKPGP